jgi:hypothetical protein
MSEARLRGTGSHAAFVVSLDRQTVVARFPHIHSCSPVPVFAVRRPDSRLDANRCTVAPEPKEWS